MSVTRVEYPIINGAFVLSPGKNLFRTSKDLDDRLETHRGLQKRHPDSVPIVVDWRSTFYVDRLNEPLPIRLMVEQSLTLESLSEYLLSHHVSERIPDKSCLTIQWLSPDEMLLASTLTIEQVKLLWRNKEDHFLYITCLIGTSQGEASATSETWVSQGTQLLSGSVTGLLSGVRLASSYLYPRKGSSEK